MAVEIKVNPSKAGRNNRVDGPRWFIGDLWNYVTISEFSITTDRRKYSASACKFMELNGATATITIGGSALK